MFLSLLAVAIAGSPSGDFPIDATVKVLPNGLTVVLEEDHRTDQVALHLHYDVGSRDERDGEKGCAHLFEHIMFEGSANVPGAGFDEWLTAAGGWNNAFTSEDETAYYMVFPSGAMELALFLESDRMAYLLAGLTQVNLENQQSIVLQERATGYAEPHGRDWDAISRLLYPPGHPYHTPVIGTVADVAGFQLEQTKSFWTRHYRPRNATLGIVGNFDTAETLAQVEHWFGDVPDPGAAEPRPADPAPPADGRSGVIEDGVEDHTLYLMWNTVPHHHADEAALDVLAYVLSGGRGTRLDDALYYKSRKTTAVDTVTWNNEIAGLFGVIATTDKGSLPPLEKAILKGLAAIEKSPPTEAELTRARKTIKSGMLERMEEPAERAQVIVDCQRLLGRPDCVEEQWARYEAVTALDVVRVARTYVLPYQPTALSVIPKGAAGALADAVPVELP